AREGDVDRVLGEPRPELARVEFRAPALQQGFQGSADLVPGLADRAALVRRQLSDPPEDLGQLGLAPEVADPELLELVRARGAADRGGRLVPDLLYPLS